MGGRGGAHPLAKEREGALLALAAGEPAAAVADVVEVAPQAGIGQKLGGGFSVEPQLCRLSHPACPRAVRERRRPASRARGRGDGRRRLRRGWPARPAATRPQRLARNSASTTALSWAPAAAKVAWSLGGSCNERTGATIGWPDSSAGVSSLCAASGWRGGSTTTQRI